MSDQIVFFVAGYPAAGKSSLLYYALTHRVPIFGLSLDEAFRDALSIKNPNERMPSQEKIDRRMWLTLLDLPVLQAQSQPSRNIVFHLDLLLLTLSTIRPRRLSDFNAEALRRCFDQFLGQDVFRSYDRLAANTIRPPIDLIAAQWSKREMQTDFGKNPILAMKNEIVAVSPHREIICEAIYSAWLEVVGEKAVESFITRPGARN